MHHKRKRATCRKEGERYGHKTARQVAKRALEGGHPKTVHGAHWSGSMPQPPLMDESPPYKKSPKKTRPKKQKCRVNGTHEWYYEWTTEQDYIYRPSYCHRCRNSWASFYFGGYGRWDEWVPCEHMTKLVYEIRTKTKTCIHCWESKRMKTTSERPGYGWDRKPTFKKRPIQW